jgi:hypothetical protein
VVAPRAVSFTFCLGGTGHRPVCLWYWWHRRPACVLSIGSERSERVDKNLFSGSARTYSVGSHSLRSDRFSETQARHLFHQRKDIRHTGRTLVPPSPKTKDKAIPPVPPRPRQDRSRTSLKDTHRWPPCVCVPIRFSSQRASRDIG